MAESGSDPEQEALRLKSTAEAEFKSSDLNSALKHAKAARRILPSMPGLSNMITCFKILTAASVKADTGMPDFYGVLQVEPFSHINSIRKQYKSLALAIHPDKNPSLGSAEAFKAVGDAYRVLSDSIRRKEYDLKLRIRMQDEAAASVSASGDDFVERFWTACSLCKILHQFEKQYLGHSLVCPSCGKSFKAVEIGDNNDNDDDGIDDEDDLGAEEESLERQTENAKLGRKAASVDRSGRKRKVAALDITDRGEVELDRGKLRSESRGGTRRVGNTAEEQVDKEKAIVVEEMSTLAEMLLKAKQNIRGKIKSRGKEKETGIEKEAAAEKASSKVRASDTEARVSLQRFETSGASDSENKPLRVYTRGNWARKTAEDEETVRTKSTKKQDEEMIMVKDSDFYDFDKDRSGRRFKKGQVWATYDEEDEMPRNYCLIDEVVSVSPFMLRVSWLDLQDVVRQPRSRTTSTLFCGQYKVAQKATIKSVKSFSHAVNCERAAKDLYRVFPEKGSIWALFKGSDSYDIVIFLTSYSDVYGLSMAYLERVSGFKTVFKRREIGAHAVQWLDKSEVGVCSHQIPARKLEAGKVQNQLKDCWELDPAALPPNMLMIPRKR